MRNTHTYCAARSPASHTSSVRLFLSLILVFIFLVCVSDLKLKQQVDRIAAIALSINAMLRNVFMSSDPFLWKKLFTTYVRQLFEFAIQAWRPHLKGDIETLERVQNAATNYCWCSAWGLSYQILLYPSFKAYYRILTHI